MALFRHNDRIHAAKTNLAKAKLWEI